MGLLSRALSILFLPIVIFIFMVGWVSNWLVNQRNRYNVETLRRHRKATKSNKAIEYVEIGVIEDLMEELLEIK